MDDGGNNEIYHHVKWMGHVFKMLHQKQIKNQLKCYFYIYIYIFLILLIGLLLFIYLLFFFKYIFGLFGDF